jgi:hypothetical protein
MFFPIKLSSRRKEIAKQTRKESVWMYR